MPIERRRNDNHQVDNQADNHATGPTTMKQLSSMPPYLRLAIALPAALLCAAPALAQDSGANPWYLGASLSHYFADNVFRVNDGRNSDRITSLSLLAGVDTRLGRQHVYANTRWQKVSYQDNGQLDNDAYSLAGGVDWETAGNLSGSLNYTRARTLADFNSNTTIAPSSERNLQTDQSAVATVRLGLSQLSTFALEGTFARRERDYSLALWESQAYRQNASSLGLLYNASSAWRFGVAGRYTQGKVPVNGFEYDRRDIDLTARWRATGASSLDARVSRSTSDSFHGVTGAVVWDWRPGGRWSLNTKLSRDTGVETYYLGVANAATSDFNRIQTSLDTQLSYRLSGKVSLSAGGSYSRTSRDDLTRQVTFRDSSRQYTFGVAWQALRAVSVGCSYSRVERRTGNILYTYDADTYGCYVQGMLQ
jgi:hypothetical protein